MGAPCDEVLRFAMEYYSIVAVDVVWTMRAAFSLYLGAFFERVPILTELIDGQNSLPKSHKVDSMNFLGNRALRRIATDCMDCFGVSGRWIVTGKTSSPLFC
jgi:hypothetical protein